MAHLPQVKFYHLEYFELFLILTLFSTNSRHSHPIAPNLLQRRFSFERPNQTRVGDITYIPTGEGWLYLATVKERCTKKVVGYDFSGRIDTQLTLDALDMVFFLLFINFLS